MHWKLKNKKIKVGIHRHVQTSNSWVRWHNCCFAHQHGSIFWTRFPRTKFAVREPYFVASALWGTSCLLKNGMDAIDTMTEYMYMYVTNIASVDDKTWFNESIKNAHCQVSKAPIVFFIVDSLYYFWQVAPRIQNKDSRSLPYFYWPLKEPHPLLERSLVGGIGLSNQPNNAPQGFVIYGVWVWQASDWLSGCSVSTNKMSSLWKEHSSSCSMVKDENKFNFDKDERVLCYHGPFIYEAKVIDWGFLYAFFFGFSTSEFRFWKERRRKRNQTWIDTLYIIKDGSKRKFKVFFKQN